MGTHSGAHRSAVINQPAGHADAGVPTTPAGYQRLLDLAGTHGEVAWFGVRAQGPTGLVPHLRVAGQTVIKVDGPRSQDPWTARQE